MDKCKYSVVIPIYNEFNSILPLYNNLSYEMNKLQDSYEIIFVNDGSVPMEGMCHLKNSMDKNISKIVDLPKRMGQTKALAVGFKESRGDIIISMDGDLQDNPKYIPNFIEKSFAANFLTGLAIFSEKFFLHNRLSGNAGVISSRQPQSVIAKHPPVPRHNVLHGVIQRMPHVQNAGHIGRRNHDGKGFAAAVFSGRGHQATI